MDDDGTEITRMIDNEIGVEGEGEYADYAIRGTRMDLAGVEQHCYLDPARHLEPNGDTRYYLLFTYTGPRDLHIVNRRSLSLVIDGTATAVLVGRGDVIRQYSPMNGVYTESFYYYIPAEVLVRLAEADEVNVVVTGRDFQLDCYLLDKNFDGFRRFAKEYVEWVE